MRQRDTECERETPSECERQCVSQRGSESNRGRMRVLWKPERQRERDRTRDMVRANE